MHVLVVESKADSATPTEQLLRSQGFSVHSTDSVEEVLSLVRYHTYEIVVLDLSGATLFSALRTLRSHKVRLPVLVLSEMATIEHKIHALDLGADDYLGQPFHKGEFLAHIRAIVRRTYGYTQSVIEVEDLALNLNSHGVTIKGVWVDLSPMRYRLLRLLMLRAGQTVTREAAFEHLYGGDGPASTTMMDVYVMHLRRIIAEKLGKEAQYIKTVFRIGYILRAPV